MKWFQVILIFVLAVGTILEVTSGAPTFVQGLRSEWKNVLLPPAAAYALYLAIFYGVVSARYLYRKKYWVVVIDREGILSLLNLTEPWPSENIRLRYRDSREEWGYNGAWSLTGYLEVFRLTAAPRFGDYNPVAVMDINDYPKWRSWIREIGQKNEETKRLQAQTA